MSIAVTWHPTAEGVYRMLRRTHGMKSTRVTSGGRVITEYRLPHSAAPLLRVVEREDGGGEVEYLIAEVCEL